EEKAKSRPTKDEGDKLNAELDKDKEYMETKEVVNEGMQNTVDTTRPDVSTARQELSSADKRKGSLEEHESVKKMTKSDFDVAQIVRDEEIARQLEVEL
nr:hypothetical protein [Tanacetum cinerariifolium]